MLNAVAQYTRSIYSWILFVCSPAPKSGSGYSRYLLAFCDWRYRL